MINPNDKLKHKYAYNINDSTKTRKISLGSGNDFLSLNKGFYDEIENKDVSIKNKNRELKKIKNDSLKEFVFTNVQIPDKWKTKLDYQESVMKILTKDNNFLSYVGRGGGGILSKNDTISTKMFTRDNFSRTGNIMKNKGTGSSTCYSQVFPKIDKQKFNIIEDKKLGSNDLTQINYRTKDEDLSKIDNETKVSFQKGKSKKGIMNEKDIINLLEEFKTAYPIKLPKEEEGQLEKISEHQKKSIKSNLLFSQEFNYNKLLQKNLKYNASDNFHKIRIKRQRAFRQNIFNNLIPPKNAKIIDVNQKNNTNYINSYKKIKTMNRTTSFLNSDSESFYRKYKISNPVIERNLENINFYGPYYSYCPPCLNRNLEFYNNLEPNQCLKLIHYIKKIRKKSILNFKENNSSSATIEKKSKNADDLVKNENSVNDDDTNMEKKDTIELSN
jgi:hypothetical protein